MALLYDRATISGGTARITPEGYLVADAFVARANNIQEYTAGELSLADRDPGEVIRVFRPETEVFAEDSLATLARIPITVDHPVRNGEAVMVDSRNWRDYAKGEIGEEVMRDGDRMRITLRVTDAAAVQAVQADRKEFSLGYGANIRFEAGNYQGQAYDAIAADLRYNHLAACRAARGGADLRITDERPALQPTGAPTMPKIVTVDGLPVNVEDANSAEATINKLVADRDSAVTDMRAAQGQVTERDTAIAAKDAEIVTLKEQVTSATPTPQALRDAAASYARTIAMAKALGVADITDAMDEQAVRKAAVAHKMGDAAANYTDADNAAAFAALVAGLPANVSAGAVSDSLRDMLADGPPASLADAETERGKARDARMDRYANRHLGAKAPNNGAAAQ